MKKTDDKERITILLLIIINVCKWIMIKKIFISQVNNVNRFNL